MNNKKSKIKWTSQVFERETRCTLPSQDLKLTSTELSEIEIRQEYFISKNYKKLKKLLVKNLFYLKKKFYSFNCSEKINSLNSICKPPKIIFIRMTFNLMYYM